jgi:hypothetical protein
MKRLFALILVGWMIAGCKTQAPVCDPFIGRTTIPPPSTGAVTGRPADPCYQSLPLASTPSPTPAGLSPPVIQLPSQPSAQSSNSQPAPMATTPGQATSLPGWSSSGSAPRPSSTLPGGNVAPRPAPLAPSPATTSPNASPGVGPSVHPGANPYTPPPSNSTDRGSSTQGSTPAVPGPTGSRSTTATFASLPTARPGAAGDDRTPRPVDDGAAAGQPIIRTIQPRGRDESSDRPVDIADLPKIPAAQP